MSKSLAQGFKAVGVRTQAREFANELRASTKVSRSIGAWLDSSQSGAVQCAGGADTSIVFDAYAKMLWIFIPLLVDESSFFASFRLHAYQYVLLKSSLVIALKAKISLNPFTPTSRANLVV